MSGFPAGGARCRTIRADAPHAKVPSRRVPSGARRSCSRDRARGSGAADLSAGRVVLHKPTGDAWRGIGWGVKSRFVKPSSERSIRPRAKSVGSSGGVERRRVESTSSEVLLVEASSFVTRRLPSRGDVGSGLGQSGGRSPKGISGRSGGDGASEVRLETDRSGLQSSKVTTGPPKRGVSP
jgi:hypothetical protein